MPGATALLGIALLLLRCTLPAGVERLPRLGHVSDRSSWGGAPVVPSAPELPQALEKMEKGLEQSAKRSFVDLLPPRFVQVAAEHLASEMVQSDMSRTRGSMTRARTKEAVAGLPSSSKKKTELAPSPAVVTVPPPQDFDVLTCDLRECNPMCVCQKLLWAMDINAGQGNAGQTTDEICYKWSDERTMKLDCEALCLTVSQVVDAASGTDPYVCLKAVSEAKYLVYNWPSPSPNMSPSPSPTPATSVAAASSKSEEEIWPPEEFNPELTGPTVDHEFGVSTDFVELKSKLNDGQAQLGMPLIPLLPLTPQADSGQYDEGWYQLGDPLEDVQSGGRPSGGGVMQTDRSGERALPRLGFNQDPFFPN